MSKKQKLLTNLLSMVSAARVEDEDIARRKIEMEELALDLGFEINWYRYKLEVKKEAHHA